jgi:ClpP class serine protease
MLWLLLEEVFFLMEGARKAGVIPSAEQDFEYQARFNAGMDAGGSRILTTAGDTAEISVRGTLTNRPHFMASIYGGGNTTYGEIVAALASAEQDDTVKEIVLAIDSPGGQFDGLFTVTDAIQACDKPVKAVVSGVAASAAYAIASQADTIEAANRAVRIGSIGVRADFMVWPEDVTVTSTQAPKKAPDVTTEEGKAMIREQLDEMHDLFVEAIAQGRDITPKTVNDSFGQGATVLSDEALSRGMIDSIAQTALKSVPSATTSTQNPTASSGNDNPETLNMDLNQLKTEHPAVYAEAVAVGQNGERDRVSAHVTMGEACGDMSIALKAIKEGADMSATLQAEYMAAGMNKADKTKAGEDDAASAAAAAGGDPQAGAESIEDQVIDSVCEGLNLGEDLDNV